MATQDTQRNTRLKGLLAVWTDVEPAAEADFNAWYNREHLAERADIAGFLNSRRYAAVKGAPAYFAAYDTQRVEVLGSPTYVQAISRQTPWSDRVTALFRNTTRFIGVQVADAGRGVGGALLTLRYGPDAAGARALAEGLGSVVAPTLAVPGIVRVTVALGVAAALKSDPADPPRLARDAPDTVALLVEGDDAPALRAAEQGPLSRDALRKAGAGEPVQSAHYRMLVTVLPE